MQPYPPPRPTPNYTARRLVAGTALVLVVWLVYVLVSAAFGGAGDETVTTSTVVVPTTTTVPLRAPDSCAVPETAEPSVYVADGDWYRTLLDTTYALPDDYVPSDLVSAAEAGYGAQFLIRSVVVEDLNRLRNAILAQGLPEVALLAAYRSIDDQRSLFDRRVEELGFEAAVEGTARPGHSEHHLGTAIDVRLVGEADVDQGFGETPTGRWLAENSWRYGFLVSYPADVEHLTCYKYEPWHLRYVGPDLAGRVWESGLSLREYLWHWEVTGFEPGVAPSAAERLPLPTTSEPAAPGEPGE